MTRLLDCLGYCVALALIWRAGARGSSVGVALACVAGIGFAILIGHGLQRRGREQKDLNR